MLVSLAALFFTHSPSTRPSLCPGPLQGVTGPVAVVVSQHLGMQRPSVSVCADTTNNARRYGHPLAGTPSLSGWGRADFQLRLMGILGSSLTAWLRNGCRNAWQTVVL